MKGNQNKTGDLTYNDDPAALSVVSPRWGNYNIAKITLLKIILPFEEHIIRHNHCRTVIDLQQLSDVLDKVELLVIGGHPEVFALIGQFIPLGLAFTVDNGYTALLAEGWINLSSTQVILDRHVTQ